MFRNWITSRKLLESRPSDFHSLRRVGSPPESLRAAPPAGDGSGRGGCRSPVQIGTPAFQKVGLVPKHLSSCALQSGLLPDHSRSKPGVPFGGLEEYQLTLPTAPFLGLLRGSLSRGLWLTWSMWFGRVGTRRTKSDIS